MTATTTATDLGRTIGLAIARDVLASRDIISCEWTGIEDQDGDILTAAGIKPRTPEWSAAEDAAEAAYLEAIEGR